MSKNNDIFSIVCGIAGLVGIGYAIGTHTKLAKVSERLDKSINELAYGMEIDIPEEMVNKAIEKAVAEETERAVARATDVAIDSLKLDIRTKVMEAINEEYDQIKESVLKEITDKASKIDANRVRRDVEAAAKKAALEKFDDNLDDILEKFNDNLTSTSKIYSSIRDAISGSANQGKEFVFHI